MNLCHYTTMVQLQTSNKPSPHHYAAVLALEWVAHCLPCAPGSLFVAEWLVRAWPGPWPSAMCRNPNTVQKVSPPTTNSPNRSRSHCTRTMVGLGPVKSALSETVHRGFGNPAGASVALLWGWDGVVKYYSWDRCILAQIKCIFSAKTVNSQHPVHLHVIKFIARVHRHTHRIQARTRCLHYS